MESPGKTTLALHIAAKAQRKGGEAVNHKACEAYGLAPQSVPVIELDDEEE